MTWTLDKIKGTTAQAPILIEGLPGVGNVGKIAVEYLIDALKAKKVYELHSDELPHYVFVNEENIIELPSIDMHVAKVKGKTILLLSGDVQPGSEVSCRSFCRKVLDTFEKTKGKEIISLGGIALQDIPKKPQMYVTGNSKKVIKKYMAGAKPKKELHEFIGPIVGVTGILPGLAGKKDIPAISMLVETFESPGYIGLHEAGHLVKRLNKLLQLNLKEKDIDRTLQSNATPEKKVKKSKKEVSVVEESDEEDSLSYIG